MIPVGFFVYFIIEVADIVLLETVPGLELLLAHFASEAEVAAPIVAAIRRLRVFFYPPLVDRGLNMSRRGSL